MTSFATLRQFYLIVRITVVDVSIPQVIVPCHNLCFPPSPIALLVERVRRRLGLCHLEVFVRRAPAAHGAYAATSQKDDCFKNLDCVWLLRESVVAAR